MKLGFALFFDLIARGEQSLAVEVCWQLISVIFAANAPPDFMPNSLILTSSMSFGEYLNAGATCTKLGQSGRKPRPAGLSTLQFRVIFCQSAHECKYKQIQCGFIQNAQTKTERLEP